MNLETPLLTWKQHYLHGNMNMNFQTSLWTWKHDFELRVSKLIVTERIKMSVLWVVRRGGSTAAVPYVPVKWEYMVQWYHQDHHQVTQVQDQLFGHLLGIIRQYKCTRPKDIFIDCSIAPSSSRKNGKLLTENDPEMKNLPAKAIHLEDWRIASVGSSPSFVIKRIISDPK